MSLSLLHLWLGDLGTSPSALLTCTAPSAPKTGLEIQRGHSQSEPFSLVLLCESCPLLEEEGQSAQCGWGEQTVKTFLFHLALK